MPYDTDDWNSLGDISVSLREKYPKIGTDETDWYYWAEEGFNITTEFVYEGIKEDELLPDWYVTEG